jgi:5'-3' exonuclease
MNPPLYLLDGTLLFFRALFGLPDLFHDAAGRSINGARGYSAYLLKLLEGNDVQFCAAAFDESLTTCWRNDVYPDYKANRPEADENVLYQLGLCREITEALGIPVLADADFEADDFIATLARKSRRNVVIVSRDKDLQQLLDESVALLDPSIQTLQGPESFQSEFQFDAKLFPDYQALTGDSVDNIPGVRGVGPKSAKALVNGFGSLESIYAAESEWPSVGIKSTSKMAERLREERELAFLFRRILRLDDRVPVTLSLAETRLDRPSHADLREDLERLQLGEGLGGSLMRALESWSV